MKALVVDDDLYIRRITHYALSRADWTVTLAANGLEAIDKARQTFPDVILLDVMMPDLDGLSTLDILRSDPETSGIPVIFLTARKGELEEQKLRAAGAIGLISKPFDPPTLSERIHLLLSPAAVNVDPGDMGKLRDEFVREAAAKLVSLDSLIERAPLQADQGILTEILLAFHHLSGTGATYGFPGVSEIANRGESELEVFVREELKPGPEDCVRWRSLVTSLRTELEQGATDTKKVLKAPALEIMVVDPVGDLFFDYAHRGHDSLHFSRVATVDEALVSARANAPNAAIVSLQLAGQTAYRLIDDLRQTPNAERLMIVAVEAADGLTDQVEVIRSGVDAIFPRHADPDAVVERLRLLLSSVQSSPARVLSVEDDPAQAAFITSVLSSAGFHVRICGDPRSLEGDLVSFKPDLVLMDVLLPGFTGFELVQFMRMHNAYAQVPVLFLTTEARVEVHIQTLRSGGDGYLTKPVSPALLIAAVAAQVERSLFLRSIEGRDGLTGLLTHTSFLTRTEVMVTERQRSQAAPFLLMLLDVDDFAGTNERFGPVSADQVLANLAALLRRRIRQSDLLGRYGSNRFIVLLRDLEIDGAGKLTVRLLREFSATGQNLTGQQVFTSTFTAALCSLAPRHLRMPDWIREAELALDYGKAEGGNRIVLVRAEGELETLFAE
ncbi:MAG TPA: response regulator [Thermoanaerobaculia bacterium]|nr:response regulator [Thermoanaerobaculia bacterium]